MRYFAILSGCLGLILIAWILSDGEALPGRVEIGGATGVEGAGEALPGGESGAEVLSPATAETEGERQGIEPGVGPGHGEPMEAAGSGFRVRVVDQEAQPVGGVGVELELAVQGMGHEEIRSVVSRASDGIAAFGLGELEELRTQLEAHSLGYGIAVRADVASPEPVRLGLEEWPQEGEEVELILPATGSVVVHVFLPDGQPAPEGMSVHWRWLPADVALGDPTEGYERPARDRENVEGQGGTARIDGVGLGLALSLQAWMPGRESANAVGVLGPTRPGEVIELDMILGVRHAEVSFRVLDPGGVPLANAKLRARQFDHVDRVLPPTASPPRASGRTLYTDEAGILRYPMVAGTADGERRLDLVRGRQGGRPEEIEAWGSASIRLPRTLASGEQIELGDLRLRSARILIEGHVVDLNGVTVEGASLDFDWRLGTSPEHVWHRGFQYRVETDSQGHFELRDIRDPADLRLHASAEGFRRTTLEHLQVGARDLIVELSPEGPEAKRGSLRVHVEMDSGVSFMECLLRVRKRDGGGRTPDWFPGAPMVVEHLIPGIYDVWIETRDGDFELARVEGVEVRADEVAVDTRLLPLDARGTARTVGLRLNRSDGSAWRRQSVELRVPGMGKSFAAKTDDEGAFRCVLPSAATSLDLAISAARIVQVPIGPGEEPIPVVLDE